MTCCTTTLDGCVVHDQVVSQKTRLGSRLKNRLLLKENLHLLQFWFYLNHREHTRLHAASTDFSISSSERFLFKI